MSRYRYEAINELGETVSGEVEAESVGRAAALVEAGGMRVESIRMVVEPGADLDGGNKEWRENLRAAIEKREDWLPAMAAMVEELPAGRVKLETQKLYRLLASGFSPEDLLHSPRLMATLPLIAAGAKRHRASSEDAEQTSGEAVDSLNGDQLKKWLRAVVLEQELRVQSWQAFVYPVVMVILCLTLLVLFSFFLIPIFKEMFADFGLSLPAPTLLVIFVSDQVTQYLLRTVVISAILGVIGFVCIWFWRKHALTNRLFGRLVAGTSSNLRAMSRFTSSVAELIALGASKSDALLIAGRTCKHELFRRAGIEASEVIRYGQLPNAESGAMRFLPATLSLALNEGEPNVNFLREIAAMYSERSQRKSNWFISLFPSLAVLMVGLVVGFVVISLFMPLVTLISALA